MTTDMMTDIVTDTVKDNEQPTSRRLSEQERLDRLRLFRSQNIGPISYYALMERFGDAGHVLDALPGIAQHGGARRIRICSKERARAEMAQTEAMGGQMLFHDEPDYPESLRATEGAPPVISLLGHKELLGKTCVAIVGTRNASAAARELAGQIAHDLSQQDCIIVSGMARGIDTAAHTTSLSGGTIAVLAGGVDVVYPPENEKLYKSIIEQGAVLSEMPSGMKPTAHHFPRRNRILSGLSLATVVIEAARRSGALITARFALEQGRPVLAVPGFPGDPRAGGVNALLRDGAVLVENAEDILREIALMRTHPFKEDHLTPPVADYAPPEETPIAETDRQIVFDLLSTIAVPVDTLIRESGLAPAKVATILLELDVAGRIRREMGQKIART